MRVAVIGAGPAGLLFARLAKRRHPAWRIEVAEQNSEGATYGVGGVFSRGAVAFLERAALPSLFQPKIDLLTNRFAWYATPQRFDCLTLPFRSNADGAFVAIIT